MESLKTGQKVLLKSHHIFGRNKAKADTLLENKDISQIHASVRWDGREWILTDLGRNGTWVDDIRLIPGKSAGLKKGSIVRFGSAEESAWKLTDHKAPATVLIPLKGEGPVIELNHFHALPDDQTPDISIYISPAGQWVCENEKGVIPLNDGDFIYHGREVWQFFCAQPVDVTVEREYTKNIKFCFYVSHDEEHVLLKIQHGQNTKIQSIWVSVHTITCFSLWRARG